jgi:hypothetical protein
MKSAARTNKPSSFSGSSGSGGEGNRVNSMARAILLASTSLIAPMRSITNSFDLSTW